MAAIKMGVRPDANEDTLDATSRGIEIHRCTPTIPVTGIILDANVFGVQQHWLGRSTPHIEPATECEGCQKGRPKRWEGFFTAWSQTQSKTFLVGFPAGALPYFDTYLEANESLRGAQFRLHKPGMKQQSRVQAVLQPSNFPSGHLPHGVDIAKVLSQLWKIDLNAGPSIEISEIYRRVNEAAETVPFAGGGSASNGTENVPLDDDSLMLQRAVDEANARRVAAHAGQGGQS